MLIKKINLSIRKDKYLSSPFTSLLGVAQGDPLSPNLVKIFINDISEYISIHKDTSTLNNKPLSHLLYADDLCIFTKSKTDLQKSIIGLEKNCEQWGLKVNIDKSKVVTFNKRVN